MVFPRLRTVNRSLNAAIVSLMAANERHSVTEMGGGFLNGLRCFGSVTFLLASMPTWSDFTLSFVVVVVVVVLSLSCIIGRTGEAPKAGNEVSSPLRDTL